MYPFDKKGVTRPRHGFFNYWMLRLPGRASVKQQARSLSNSIGTITFSLGSVRFRYDLATGYLQRLGGGGLNLAVGKPQRILAMLIEAAPILVSKGAIFTKVGVGSDGALQQQIQTVRKLLIDLADDPAFDAKHFVVPKYGEGYILDTTGLEFQSIKPPVGDAPEVDMDAVLGPVDNQDSHLG